MIPDLLVGRLAGASRVVVLTGAGVSAESGVPTFRDAQTGLWARFRPEELATPEAFAANPKRVWEWYAWRRDLVRKAQPNPAHVALAELETLIPELVLVTQNVDGLHQRAGSSDVLELHGNVTRIKCAAEDREVRQWDESRDAPPRCPDCGAPLRPDVVWFGERLPEATFTRALAASARCEVLLSIGTSGLVHPAALLPQAALESGAFVIEINPEASTLTDRVDLALPHAAGIVLPALVQRLREALGRRI